MKLTKKQRETIGKVIKKFWAPKNVREYNKFNKERKLMLGDFTSDEKEKWFNQYRPVGDKLFVKPIKKQYENKAGIIIPNTVSEDTMEGEVVAVGPGKEEPIPAKKGDRVIFTKYSPTKVSFDDGDELYIIESKYLKAVIEE